MLPMWLLQAWLLFFYTSLALRENILRVNGSDIRPWYFSSLNLPTMVFVKFIRFVGGSSIISFFGRSIIMQALMHFHQFRDSFGL